MIFLFRIRCRNGIIARGSCGKKRRPRWVWLGDAIAKRGEFELPAIFPARWAGKIESWPGERKIWAVKRVVQQLSAPLLLHVSGFAKKLLWLSKRGRIPARRRFTMNQVRV